MSAYCHTASLHDEEYVQLWLDRFSPNKNLYNCNIYGITSYRRLSGTLYDAVMMWAYATNKSLEQGYSFDDGYHITQNILNHSFEGMGGEIMINENGDRKTNNLLGMIQNGKFVNLFKYFSTEERLLKLYKPQSPSDWSGLLWPGNRTSIPKDHPQCGWKGELCGHFKSNNFKISVSFTTLALILAMAIFIFILWKMR